MKSRPRPTSKLRYNALKTTFEAGEMMIGPWNQQSMLCLKCLFRYIANNWN